MVGGTLLSELLGNLNFLEYHKASYAFHSFSEFMNSSFLSRKYVSLSLWIFC